MNADYLLGRCIPLLQILKNNEQAVEVLNEIKAYCAAEYERQMTLAERYGEITIK